MRTALTPLQRHELVQRYNEPFRVYHNLEHITILFQLAAAHGLRLSIPQQLAIWYHDAIYFPNGGVENEQRSAELLRSHMESNCWISKALVDRAYKMILATKRHLSDDNETQVVLDLDLAGLGFDSESYYSAACKVRVEYNHLPDEVWNTNRAIFLKGMLDREYIFYTSWGRDFYEKQARRNMQAELNQLQVEAMLKHTSWT